MTLLKFPGISYMHEKMLSRLLPSFDDVITDHRTYKINFAYIFCKINGVNFN